VPDLSTRQLPPIRGFQPGTLLDWPGRIAAILFLPGCDFRCPYCHSRDLIGAGEPLEDLPFEQILAQLGRRRKWVDGVVITGGEPLIHPHLVNLIDLLRAEGLKIKLDTNGSRPDALAELLDAGRLDYVAMDLKAPLDARYERVAGVPVDLSAIRRSMGLLLGGRVDYEFRTTWCPALLAEADILEIAHLAAAAKRWLLQPFRPVSCLARWLEQTDPPPRAAVESLVDRCRSISPNCRLRGRD
jgi:pyruvate formate lyase activating enzyme